MTYQIKLNNLRPFSFNFDPYTHKQMEKCIDLSQIVLYLENQAPYVYAIIVFFVPYAPYDPTMWYAF